MLGTLYTLGDLVKSKRESLGLTQKEFAELIGLKGSGDRTVSGWERGEHQPSASKIRCIEEIGTNVPFKKCNSKNIFSFIFTF